MPSKEKLAKKNAYFEKLIDLCHNYPNALIVHVDHVGSKQMQDIRVALRGKAIVLMGKNSMIRKALSIGHERHPDAGMDKIKQIMVGNIGFIFATDGTLDEVRETIGNFKVMSAAKAGQLSLVDWTIPSGPTGMDPSQTSFFQALNIGTKIVKGQIEITSPVNLITAGVKVGESEAALLTKLNIRPFSYGLVIDQVFDNGSLFSVDVLDIDDAYLATSFQLACSKLAAVSLAIGYPTQASMVHSIGNAFKNLVAVTLGLNSFSFSEADDFKEALKNPGAFACAAPSGGGAAAAAVVEAPKEEEVDALEGGMDMFGGDGDEGDY